MVAKGAFTFVLHSHLPYARMAGRWPHGEEWVHEAAVETYIPLLNTLYDLKEQGVDYKITVGITPILAEQLADTDILINLDEYIADKIERAQQDLERFTTPIARRAVDDEEEEEEDEELEEEDDLDDDDFDDDDDLDDFDDEDEEDDDDDDDFEDDDDDDEDETFNKLKTIRNPAAAPGVEKFDTPVEVSTEIPVVVAAQVETPTAWWENNPQAAEVARFYIAFFENTARTLKNRFQGDILGAFKKLQDDGYIEITTCAATHGYLPLIGQDTAIFAQLETGTRAYKRLFGRAPRGIWLPECAYRPAYYEEIPQPEIVSDKQKGSLVTSQKKTTAQQPRSQNVSLADEKIRPGIEQFLADQGLKVFFSETHLVTGGQPVGIAAGEAIGPYGAIKRKYLVPMASAEPTNGGTTMQSYYVADTTNFPQIKVSQGTDQAHSGVAVIARNNRLGMQVWSAVSGYPGDFDYREFHRKDDVSGLQYWRVTGHTVDLGNKDIWHPDWAEAKVAQQADHFAAMVEDEISTYQAETGEFGLVSCNYDTELFGHWWFEGVAWLKEVLRRLAANPNIELTTASAFVEQHPPKNVILLPEGSWGSGGTHFTWDNEDTHWMWTPIRAAEKRMTDLANRYRDTTDQDLIQVLNQAARELLLLESSDWPFLVTTGQARQYAVERFTSHTERFTLLADGIDREEPDANKAAELYELDKVFSDIDFRDWTRVAKELGRVDST